MNGEVCCILGICCPPNSARQREALEKELLADGVCENEAHAKKVATFVLKHFDLAPAGSLSTLKASIAEMARVSKGQ